MLTTILPWCAGSSVRGNAGQNLRVRTGSTAHSTAVVSISPGGSQYSYAASLSRHESVAHRVLHNNPILRAAPAAPVLCAFLSLSPVEFCRFCRFCPSGDTPPTRTRTRVHVVRRARVRPPQGGALCRSSRTAAPAAPTTVSTRRDNTVFVATLRCVVGYGCNPTHNRKRASNG